MPFYNTLLKHLILPIGDVIFSGSYLKYLKQWQDYDGKSESELKSIQEKNLNAILNYSKKHVPYYKNLNIQNLGDFPVLTKQILRNSSHDLVSDEFKIQDLDKHHSSGSSGVQSFTYMTKDHTFFLRALQTNWWHWSGYKLGDNLLQFGISQERSVLKKIKDFFFRCTYVKAFGLSETELENILKKVSNKKQLFIAGYPSVINQLAKVSINMEITPDVSGVICFGDKLFKSYKETIYKAFGDQIKLVDTYGCAEGLLMACKHDLDYYYIMSPHVFIELVDDDGNPVKDGEIGHVLATCLTNKAMPLIRYKLGDLAVKLPIKNYPNSQKLKYPLLQKVIGRETDIVKTNHGITLNVHSFTGVLEYYQCIKQYKIIQNDLDSIIIEYIVDAKHDFNETILIEIKDKLNVLTHNCLDINFNKVKKIKATKSGKPQIIESNLRY